MMNEELQNMEYENEELKQIIEGYKGEIDKLSKENNIIGLKMKKFEKDVNNLTKSNKIVLNLIFCLWLPHCRPYLLIHPSSKTRSCEVLRPFTKFGHFSKLTNNLAD